jgi:hypothetical protein
MLELFDCLFCLNVLSTLDFIALNADADCDDDDDDDDVNRSEFIFIDMFSALISPSASTAMHIDGSIESKTRLFESE